MKSGSSSIKIKNGVSTNVLSKSNHTHEGVYIEYNAQDKSRIRLRFNLQKADFYARVLLKEMIFKNKFFE